MYAASFDLKQHPKDMNVKVILPILLCVSCVQEPESLPFFNTADFAPQWIAQGSPAYADIHRIPAFAFVDQEGDTITEKTIDGDIVVADFFFTVCPGICPRLTKNMGTVQSAFMNDEDVTLLSHSVTPDMDDVARLKVYAESHQVSKDKWHLLTGDRKQIYNIARHGYFADEETGFAKGENEFLHTENFILIDGERRIRGVYNGTNPAEVERLIEDIKTLKKETHDEKS
jgi:protein SCO1/2